MKYKIICGSSKECEEELNKLVVKHWVIVHGFSVVNENVTILVELNERV